MVCGPAVAPVEPVGKVEVAMLGVNTAGARCVAKYHMVNIRKTSTRTPALMTAVCLLFISIYRSIPPAHEYKRKGPAQARDQSLMNISARACVSKEHTGNSAPLPIF